MEQKKAYLITFMEDTEKIILITTDTKFTSDLSKIVKNNTLKNIEKIDASVVSFPTK